jgi:hypothetical protein
MTDEKRKADLKVVQGEDERLENLEKYRLPQDYVEQAGVKKEIKIIRVKRPHRQEFIRVHPIWKFEAMMFVDADERTHYLVDRKLYGLLEGELVPKVLYPYITIRGVLKIWPIKLHDADGNLDDWNSSALDIARIARDKWVRVASNKYLGAYEHFVPMGKVKDPEWPDLEFERVIEIAFKDQIIEDETHSCIKRLGLSNAVKLER